MALITLANDFGLNGNGFCRGCGKKLKKSLRYWCNVTCLNKCCDETINNQNFMITKDSL